MKFEELHVTDGVTSIRLQGIKKGSKETTWLKNSEELVASMGWSFQWSEGSWVTTQNKWTGGTTCYSRDRILKIYISEQRQLLVLTVSWVRTCEQLAQVKQKDEHCNFDFIVVWQLVLSCGNFSWRLSAAEQSWGEVWNHTDFIPLTYLKFAHYLWVLQMDMILVYMKCWLTLNQLIINNFFCF